MDLLYWFESIRNPVLDFIMKNITYLGAEVFFMVVALAIFWCVNKKEGYYLLFVGFLGTILNQFLKLLCHIPRPWVKDPKFTVVESAKAGAIGYSFPSGHTQNIVGTLGGIAHWQREKWLRAVCIVLLILVPISRMYLGVHTPLDVGVSFGIALILVFGFYPLMQWATKDSKRMYLLIGSMLVVAIAFVLYANLSDFSNLTERENIYEGRKNSFSLLGSLLGFLIAYPIETKYIRFDEKAPWWAQILKVALGLAIILGIKEGMKAAFNVLGMTWVGFNALRYFAIVVFAATVWPLTFRLFAKKEQKA